MPILCFGGAKGQGRGPLALESWQRVAVNVRGGVVEDAGHWIPEEKPEWALEEILKFFGEEGNRART
jgi:pimeloyl-ACP methyl ester carboxylesterase